MRVGAVLVEHENLAVFHVADVLGADDVERAGFRGEDGAAVEFTQHQRPDAQRVAGADEFFVGQADESVRAFEQAQPLDEPVDEAVAGGAGDEMENDLRVRRRLHHGAFAHELAAERQSIGEIAVMPNGKAAGIELGE